MDGASGLQSLSSERETWVDEEVDALLDVWGNTYIHVNRENLGKRHWETVVRDVNARLVHQREQPQMKNKIDSLKKRYKREKSSKGENDRNSITWKWFDRCDLLWGTTPSREIAASLGAPDVVELHHHHHHQDSLSLSRLAPALFLAAAMAPSEVNGDHGVKAGASSRIGGDCHEERLPEVPPSPSCSRGNRGGEGNGNGCFHVNSSNVGSVEPGGKENVKRRKLNGGAGGATVTTQSVAKMVQGLADTYATVEQARMEMTMAMEERRHQFLERMEERRVESQERRWQRKLQMEERRLALQEKLVHQKLEMQEKHMQRREILKLELLRLRLQILPGQRPTKFAPEMEQHHQQLQQQRQRQQQLAVQNCEKFSSSNIPTTYL